MYWDVISVKPFAARTLAVGFADGTRGTVYIDPSFCTGVFESLCNNELVQQAQIDNGVLVWPNGLDLAPDTLYKEIKNNPQHCYIIRR